MGLHSSYRVLKANNVGELALCTDSTGRAFDAIIRPILLLHIKPETKRTGRNVCGVIEVNQYCGSHLGPDAFDTNRIVPRMLGLPFLELSGFDRGAPCHNLELESEEEGAS